MDGIDLQAGVEKALDALFADRLALLCGAGLSMAPPSSVPSAAALAWKAKQKYDSTYGASRPPLAESIDDQAEFFFQRGELVDVYLRTYIDHDAFAGTPNDGHLAAADLLLTGGIGTAVSTNVDTLIEAAGNLLFGHVGVGVTRDKVAALPPGKSPLLKVHGCWTDPAGTVWAAGQVVAEPIQTRLAEGAAWLTQRLLDRDLVIVGYWTDWDYLNEVLEQSLAAVSPSRIIVVDPCNTAVFETKAKALFELGQRATSGFFHVQESGAVFLNQLRVEFSRALLRRVLHSGSGTYQDHIGTPPDPAWLEPSTADAQTLWRIRRDLEGAMPNEPAKGHQPVEEPLLGMTFIQLQAKGATLEDICWNLGGARIRVLRAINRPLHEVEAAYARETAPIVAPEYVIAVGAEALALPPSIARGAPTGSIARGAPIKWRSRPDAIAELGL
ncbi:SIR2 family protein [Mesorhizobium sp. M0676]|uniref:SIR2 family protein n=1 Tax=Mesorhizobium sp. M0676 TaxID=2956984 RepID=UPI0033386E6A